MQNVRQMFISAVQNQQAGRLVQAEQLYAQILAQDPNHPDALHLLGAIALQRRNLTTAADLVSRAIKINATVASFHNTLGLALAAQEKLDEASAAYRAALRLQPNMPAAHFNLAHALINQGEVQPAIAHYRQTLELDPADADSHSNLLYAMHFEPSVTAAQIAEEAARWNAAHAQPLRQMILPHSNDRNPQRTLRIGIVSPDLWGHAVGRFLLPLLQHLDREQFNVHCYTDHTHHDAVSEQLKQNSHAWRSIAGMSDEQAAAMIREDRIDVLIDLSAHSAMHRLLLFARKPAPVQATYLGYPGTTGLAAMDWRISDRLLDPPDAPPMPWIEKVCRLPGSYWCYQAPPEAPAVNELPASQDANSAITFGCLNKNYKVSDVALSLWMQLLKQVPQSRFVLLAHQGIFRQRVLRAVDAAGINPARIDFAGVQPLAQHLAGYHRIDIALDTFPYNGGTTTCDALWMGVPVVSIAGLMPVGRAGVSILTHAGFPQWIARDPSDYLRIAQELSADVQKLAMVRQQLRPTLLCSPLMNGAQAARNLEAALHTMWRQWCGN